MYTSVTDSHSLWGNISLPTSLVLPLKQPSSALCFKEVLCRSYFDLYLKIRSQMLHLHNPSPPSAIIFTPHSLASPGCAYWCLRKAGTRGFRCFPTIILHLGSTLSRFSIWKLSRATVKSRDWLFMTLTLSMAGRLSQRCMQHVRTARSIERCQVYVQAIRKFLEQLLFLEYLHEVEMGTQTGLQHLAATLLVQHLIQPHPCKSVRQPSIQFVFLVYYII